MFSRIANKILPIFVMFFLALGSPWWLTILVAVFLAFYMSAYSTVIFAGLVMDIVYRSSDSGIIGYRFTLFMIIISIVVIYLKKRLIFYSPKY